MSTQHTPGPWHVLDDGGTTDGGLTITAVDMVDGFRVAHVYPDPTDDHICAAANARLIAAAPKLLEALETIDAYEDMKPFEGAREHEIMLLRKAAAKEGMK